MGQKVNPHGLRLGINTEWDSVWYSEKKFSEFLAEDYRIRRFIKKKLYSSGVPKIVIKRTNDDIRINILTSRPGIVIGRNGQAIAELSQEIQKLTKQKVSVSIEEVKRSELDAQLSAEDIAKQLENRVTFRRAMRQAMNRSMKAGVKGIKTSVSGRLGGADMARTEHYHDGTIPLQTLRADIDYGFAEANTTYGKIGVKVWIYKGEILREKKIETKENKHRNNRKFGDKSKDRFKDKRDIRDKKDIKDRRDRKGFMNREKRENRNRDQNREYRNWKGENNKNVNAEES